MQKRPAPTVSVKADLSLFDVYVASVPGAALVEEFTRAAQERGAWHPILFLDPIHVGFHDVVEPIFLHLVDRWQFRYDQLGVFGFDQVMQLQARFLFAGGMAIEHPIARELRVVEMANGQWIGCFPAGLEINDPSTGPNEVNDADELGQAHDRRDPLPRRLPPLPVFHPV